MPYEPLPSPKKAPSPVPVPRMFSSPYYRRSVIRPLVLLAVSALAIFTFYNQTLLRERTVRVQGMLSGGLQSLYKTNRTHVNTLYQEGTEDRVVAEYDFGQNPCSRFPADTDGILLVLKTGASEVFDKLPTQLLTNLQCLPDFLLFSDHEQQLGQWHIYDALDSASPRIKENNPEFDLYRTQQECPVSQKQCLNAYRGQAGTAAWSLDKYKFMHILEKTWEMRPNQSYYVFSEADTYIFWPTLVDWLRNRPLVDNPLIEPLYVGSGAMLAGIPFAHGGSGYILSGALMRNLVEGETSISELYDAKARSHCCGDQMLAKAILERENLKVRHAHPLFNGEKPSTFPYGPTHWCDVILSMHHMEPEEISAVWQYEQTRKDNSTLLMKDLYEAFVANKMVERRTHWDNLSDDVCYVDPDPAVRSRIDDKMKRRLKDEANMNAVERHAHKSLEHCARVCEYEGYVDVVEPHEEDTKWSPDGQSQNVVSKQGEKLQPRGEGEGQKPKKNLMRPTKQRNNPLERRCFQYRYHAGICCTGKSFKLGTPKRDAEGNQKDKPVDVWYSGWHLDYINAWIQAMGECKAPKWKNPDKL